MPRWGYEDRSIPDTDPAIRLPADPAVRPTAPSDAHDELAAELRRAKAVSGRTDDAMRLGLRLLAETARAAIAQGPEAQRLAAAELRRGLDLAEAAASDRDAERRLHALAHQRAGFGYDHLVLSREVQRITDG